MMLHIIPSHVFENTFQGSYKDVRTRVLWLEAHSANYEQLVVQNDDVSLVEPFLNNPELSRVLVEYSHYPALIRRIKVRRPDVRVAVRAHNIEPLQHLDNLGWWPKRGPVWLLYGMFRLWMQDIRTKQAADAILSINEWENKIYWNRLPGKARVDWLPYIAPDFVVPSNPLPYSERNIIACVPSSQENRKSRDNVLRFLQLAQKMKRRGCRYEFVLTGRLENWDIPECPEVTRAGFVEDLAQFMGTCRAICMLSPLGYGFKTTIGDALASGAHMIVHPALQKKCPRSVSSHLVGLKNSSSGAMNRLEGVLKDAPATGDIRLQWCSRVNALLDQYSKEAGE